MSLAHASRSAARNAKRPLREATSTPTACAPTQTVSAPATPVRRDAAIDAVRAACLLVVVLLHSLMVGVQLGLDGGLRTSVALSGEPWFAPITWLLQIMPLFFIAGGFAALAQWRSMRAEGASAATYVLGRVRRLAVPALLMVLAFGAILFVAREFGADAALLEEAGLRAGQPLWFLAVYLGVTALVPAMVWLHERYPVLTIAALGAGVVLVDVLHTRGGLPVGYLNLVFVWPLMQQLGFLLSDGACLRWPTRRLVMAVSVPIALLLVLLGWGWSPDMIENLNPPTVAIALLGAAQFFALVLARPLIDRLMLRPGVRAVVRRAGGCAMTVYLWHMPLILALVVVLWAGGWPLPEPGSVAWWATRAPWLVMIALGVGSFARWFSRIEERALWLVGRSASVPVGGGAIRVALCVVLAVAGVTVALLGGLASPGGWVLAAASLCAATGLAVVHPKTRRND